jgi:hypothetical protein
LFVNSEEWKLASPVSKGSLAHLIMYTPPANQNPVYILRNNRPLRLNSFLIHRFGGIVIQNPPVGVKNYTFGAQDMHKVGEQWIRQLRQLFNVQTVDESLLESLIPTAIAPSPIGLSPLELWKTMKRLVYVNMQETKKTLVSLANLIEKLPDMFVYDHIHDLVHDSLEHYQRVISLNNFMSRHWSF